jgi:hypothetical protein
MVSVDFQPIGLNMTCQLCYRATDGTPVYSAPVSSGACSLRLDKAPGSNVVIAVICNTDYKYLGDTTRKAHYDYRLQLGAGATGTADINTKWYNVTLPVTAESHPNRAAEMSRGNELSAFFEGHNALAITYRVSSAGVGSISLFTPTGVMVKKFQLGYKRPGIYFEKLTIVGIRAALSHGLYLLSVNFSGPQSAATFLTLQ